MSFKTKEDIAEKIHVIEKINSDNIDNLKDSIPEKDFNSIKLAGDEWPLLLGYTQKSIDALHFINDKSGEEIITLYVEYKEKFDNYKLGKFDKELSPYMVVERLHVMGWILNKTEWGKMPRD